MIEGVEEKDSYIPFINKNKFTRYRKTCTKLGCVLFVKNNGDSFKFLNVKYSTDQIVLPLHVLHPANVHIAVNIVVL